MSKLKKVFKLYLGWGDLGNCFSPAIVVNVRPGRWKIQKWARVIVTIRTNSFRETTFYWNGSFRFWWNSDHLARWFGDFVDTDFGGYYVWRGHMDL